MNAISVSYRFTRQELSTLLQALRLGALPGAPLSPVDEDTASHVLKRFSDEGMAMVIDGTLYVDRLTDYLLRAAADAKSAVVITDSSRSLVLWAARKLYILGDFPEQGECALTPLQDMESVQAALEDGIRRLNRPMWGMNVFSRERNFSVSAEDALPEPQLAQAFAELL